MVKFEFDDLGLIEVEDIYVVTYNNLIIKLNGKTTFHNYNKAKKNIEYVLYCNYVQGHYWHENKDNIFSQEGGLMKNDGNRAGLDNYFKGLAKKLTEELLVNKFFEIKQIK